MFILDGKVLLPDVPFTHNGVDYAATWLRNTTLEEKMAIGVIEKTEPFYDQRFYWGYDSDDNLIPKDHNELIKLWVSQTRITAGTLLQPTDWMIIREMDDWVKPQCAIPVHGEHRHMIEHMKFAHEMNVPNPVQVENGDIVKLFPGKPHVFDKAPSGRLYLDGNMSVEEDSQSIKDRKNLSANGYMEVTILISQKGNIHKRPVLTFRGIPVYDVDEFIYGLEEAIEKTVKTFSLGSKKQEYNLIDALKITCKKYTKEMTGKKPFTNINLVKI